LPLAITVLAVWKAGALPYALGSLAVVGDYAGQMNVGKTAKDAVFLVINSYTRFMFSGVFAGAAGIVAMAFATPRADVATRRCPWVLVVAMVVWFASARFAAAVPQTMAAIYEVFLYAPALLALAAFCGWVLPAVVGSGDALRSIVLGVAFLAASLPLFGPALKKNFASGGRMHSALSMDAEHRVSDVLREISQPGDKLLVWGWAPAIYIHSGLKPATRFSQGHMITRRFSGGDHFEKAMMEDIRETPPRFIVDAMQSGFGMNTLGTWIGYYDPSRDLTAQAFYPELVAMGYVFLEKVPLADGSNALVYERKAK
jgi:hypothetical protein